MSLINFYKTAEKWVFGNYAMTIDNLHPTPLVYNLLSTKIVELLKSNQII